MKKHPGRLKVPRQENIKQKWFGTDRMSLSTETILESSKFYFNTHALIIAELHSII